MIRMIQSTSASQAKGYFTDSLQRSDYYLDGHELSGQLCGKVAVRLGIEGIATKNVFDALCENIHPRTGQSLTQRNVAKRTVGYDINFHCPKSVSILHALTDDDHLLKAFEASVRETMQAIEEDAQTRVRKQGQDNNRQTGELMWASFLHQTARPVGGTVPDPHLHSHCFVFNVTWDAVESQFKAGQFRDIKRDMPYYQARFHKVFSDRLIELGYRIRRMKTAFEVVGVPQPVIDLFSKRTDEIGRIAQILGLTDPKQVDALGARTRAKKQKGLTMAQLKQAWRNQIFALGMTDQGEGEQAIRFAAVLPVPAPSPQQCVDHALAVRFERASVVHDRWLLETAYRHSLGHRTVTVEQTTDAFLADKRIITITENGQHLCTTKQVLAEERRMVTLAQQGKGVLPPLYRSAPPITLGDEQGAAIAHVLTTPDRVSIIRGRAGTGKTTLMREAVSLIQQAGCPVMVVAPTAQAARGVLREEGFADAETVAQLLASPALQASLSNGVLWVDEAGLLNTADMIALLQLTIAQNARLILSGDTRQHSSVLRGDALRILNTIAGIKAAEVSQIYRQRQGTYRLAVLALADGDVKTGFALLDRMNAIRTLDPIDPFAQLADAYVATLKRGQTALVISPTHRAGEQVTQAIRQRLRAAGRIGQAETPVPQLINTQLTVAEKQDSRNYRPGQLIQFNRYQPNIRRGSRWQVVTVDDGRVTIQDERGAVVPLPLTDNAPFDVFDAATLALSQGDNICVTLNGLDGNGRRLTNGQMLDVERVNADGTITARNKISQARYVLPQGFGHLAHAHCITSHAAQGKTVDSVFIAQPASTFAATNRNQFYVSVSRARTGVYIYTDDKDALLAQAAQSGDRLSALEMVKHKRAVKRNTEHLIRTAPPRARQPKAAVKHTPASVEKSIQQKRPAHAPRL
ncbi:MobF family relaxase [Fibrella sp. WM1]|uniref:MobF family relaxase n=1 Tax=Fibrella musci TaxID=3242485 RepID=UPI00352188E3